MDPILTEVKPSTIDMQWFIRKLMLAQSNSTNERKLGILIDRTLFYLEIINEYSDALKFITYACERYKALNKLAEKQNYKHEFGIASFIHEMAINEVVSISNEQILMSRINDNNLPLEEGKKIPVAIALTSGNNQEVSPMLVFAYGIGHQKFVNTMERYNELMKEATKSQKK